MFCDRKRSMRRARATVTCPLGQLVHTRIAMMSCRSAYFCRIRLTSDADRVVPAPDELCGDRMFEL